jgi:hypothetical protein
VTYANGDEFRGTFDQNVKVGEGQWSWADGEGYEGVCVGGSLEGMARRRLEGVGVYDGRFREGMFHGAGVMTYDDGSVFDGEWRKGKRLNGNFT